MVCLPFLLRPPAVSSDLRIVVTQNSFVDGALPDSHQFVLDWHEFTKKKKNLENSSNTGTSFCCFHDECVEAIQEFSASMLLKSFPQLWTNRIPNEQRRQFLVHLDHNDVPIS